ncbi:MAG: hypothetical protein QOD38_1080 [Acidimicrobiaceae bacterium]|jgi:hypothetical protein
MLVAYIIRLVPEELERGRVMGEVQAVETGLRCVVRSSEDLIALLLADARRGE